MNLNLFINFKMEIVDVSGYNEGLLQSIGTLLLKLLWMSTILGLGYACGGKCRLVMGKIWREQCDLVTAELIWQYRTAFNADYDQNFNHELEKLAVELAQEVELALKKETFVAVAKHYTEINRVLHLACFISIYKQTTVTKFVQIFYLVII